MGPVHDLELEAITGTHALQSHRERLYCVLRAMIFENWKQLYRHISTQRKCALFILTGAVRLGWVTEIANKETKLKFIYFFSWFRQYNCGIQTFFRLSVVSFVVIIQCTTIALRTSCLLKCGELYCSVVRVPAKVNEEYHHEQCLGGRAWTG